MPSIDPMSTAEHLVTLVVFGLFTAGFVFAGRFNDTATRWALAAFCMGAWLFSSVFYVLPENLEPHMSLPIQACDLLALLAAITLVLPSRLMRTVMYFGGFGMTTQAFITPTSDIGGPDNIKFWIFWLLHGAILATAIYIVAVDRYRPSLRDLRNGVLFWGGYALAMIALNYGTHAAGLNEGKGWYYGYLGPHVPEVVQGSIISHLGDWPIRPMLMMAIIFSIFVLVWLPWLAVPNRKEALDQNDAPSAD